MKGYILQNKDNTYQGPFCERKENFEEAQILNSLKGIDRKRIHRLIAVEYIFWRGRKVLVTILDE